MRELIRVAFPFWMLLFILVCAGLAGLLFRIADRREERTKGEPSCAAADCGCGELDCEPSREFAEADAIASAYAENADTFGFERRVVAGSDLDPTVLVNEIYDALADRKFGVDIYQNAPKDVVS